MTACCIDVCVYCNIYQLALKYFVVVNVSKIQKALPTFVSATFNRQHLDGENWK